MVTRADTRAVRLILFSSLGSLPLHLAAVLVFAGMADDLGVTRSGIFTSAILSGLLVSCLLQALDVARFLFLSNRLGVLVIVQISLLLATPLLPQVITPVPWFVVGWISGVYMFQGMVAAANAPNKYLGFLSRVVLAMMLAGGIATVLCYVPILSSYTSVCVLYAIVVGVLYAITRPPSVERLELSEEARQARPLGLSPLMLVRLVPIVLFFTGSLMFGAHITGFVGAVADDNSILAFGIAKLVGGLALAISIAISRRDSSNRVFGAAVVMAVAMATLRHDSLVPAVLVVLGFEIALNIGGAAFMAEVARTGSDAVRRLIPAAGLAGTAIGPIGGSLLLVAGSQNLLRWAAIAVMVIGVVWLAIDQYNDNGSRSRNIQPVR